MLGELAECASREVWEETGLRMVDDAEATVPPSGEEGVPPAAEGATDGEKVAVEAVVAVGEVGGGRPRAKAHVKARVKARSTTPPPRPAREATEAAAESSTKPTKPAVEAELGQGKPCSTAPESSTKPTKPAAEAELGKGKPCSMAPWCRFSTCLPLLFTCAVAAWVISVYIDSGEHKKEEKSASTNWMLGLISAASVLSVLCAMMITERDHQRSASGRSAVLESPRRP